MSSFESFPNADESHDPHRHSPTAQPFDDDAYMGYDPMSGIVESQEVKDAKGGKDATDAKEGEKDAKDAKNGKINPPTAAGAAAANTPVSPAKDVTANGTPDLSKPEAPAELEGEQHSETTPNPTE